MKTTKKINTGDLELTAKNISKGEIRKKINFLLKDKITLDDEELIFMRRKIIPDKGIGKDIYIFAYGSLLWNPTFEYEEQFPAIIYGFHRKFCMKTNLGRGSYENPGLMLGLDKGGSCKGIVYKLKKNNQIKEIDLLYKREMVTGTYIPRLLKTKMNNGKTVTSLTFTVDQKHENYVSNLSIHQTAKLISKAHGFLGSCEEYLNYTVSSLTELNIIDKRMNDIYNVIKNKKI